MTVILSACVCWGLGWPGGGALSVNQVLLRRCRSGRPFDKFRKYSISTNVFGIYHKALYIYIYITSYKCATFIYVYKYIYMNSKPKYYENYFCCDFAQFCICQDRKAAVACAQLWLDLIIILWVTATCVITRFELWAHKSFTWIPLPGSTPRVTQVFYWYKYPTRNFRYSQFSILPV